MNRFVYNLTQLKQKEQKIYSIGDQRLNGSSGVSISTLVVVTPFAVVSTLMGWLVSFITNTSYWPFAENFSVYHLLFWPALGIGIGWVLYKKEFSGYKLYEYLLAYLRKKHVYNNDKKKTKKSFLNIKINAFIKHLL